MAQATRVTKQNKGRSQLTRRVSVDDMSVSVVAGPHQGESLSLDHEVLWLGRGEWCHLVLSKDIEVSKEHCEVRLQGEELIVKDLGSSNGLFLGGVPVIKGYWEPGVPLQLGTTVLQLSPFARKKEIELVCADPSLMLVGQSPKMRRLFAQISRLLRRSLPVLLYGETGTGKTTIARAIHEQSDRRQGPFVEVNCSAIAPALLESQFFGYTKGAFTGAERAHKGFFEQAHGGTLFLDELGELPLALQPKLLKVLESGRVRPLGSEKEVEVDVRLLASTLQHLQEQVERGQFRQDLYYRLAVIEFVVPPLRERVEDLPLLIEWWLEKQPIEGDLLFSEAALHKLQRYNWPGNVRELHNILHRTLALLEPEAYEAPEILIDTEQIVLPGDEEALDEAWMLSEPSSPGLFQAVGEWEGQKEVFSGISLPPESALKETMEALERALILDALHKEGWSMNKTAERLHISRVWLYKRIKRYKLKQERPEDL